MQFSNSLQSSSAPLVVVIIFLSLSLGRLAFAAGAIIGRGVLPDIQVATPAGSDCVAIAAVGAHSLAIREPCRYVLASDVNNDCRVDLRDFAEMAENWLIDCRKEPDDPACIPR